LTPTGWLLYICPSSIDDQTVLSKLRWRGKVMDLEAWSRGGGGMDGHQDGKLVYLRLGGGTWLG
jgi:hypothetical protein